MTSGSRVVLGTAAMIGGVVLVVLGGLGAALIGLILTRSHSVTPLGGVILVLALGGFGGAAVMGGWTLIDLARGRLADANKRRRTGNWTLLAATAIWILAAVSN